MESRVTQREEIANAARRVDKHNVSRLKSTRAASCKTALQESFLCKGFFSFSSGK